MCFVISPHIPILPQHDVCKSTVPLLAKPLQGSTPVHAFHGKAVESFETYIVFDVAMLQLQTLKRVCGDMWRL